MMSGRPRLVHILTALLLLVCLLVFFRSPGSTALTGLRAHFPPSQSSDSGADLPWAKTYRGHSSPADINRVTNKTLGFSKIFVIGLPERTDKRDAITLTAALTGFEVEWIDGVKGETIPDKAVPFGVNRKKMMETNLGSWRGHMNTVRRIVEEGLESALILEDDMDWDVRLRQQLESIATGVRKVADAAGPFFHADSSSHYSRSPSSPYGDDWDLLWLGHCGEPFPENLAENKGLAESDPARVAMSQKYVMHPDPTVPPLDKLTGIVKFKEHEPFTRWVHVTAAPICSFAYALSQRGARKILQELSVDGLHRPVDNALANLCRRAVGSWSAVAKGEQKGPKERGYDMRCLSVNPPVFFHHRAKGKMSGDSDIQNSGDKSDGEKKEEAEGKEQEKEKVREKGFTENIMWSTRLNIHNLLTGQPMDSQF